MIAALLLLLSVVTITLSGTDETGQQILVTGSIPCQRSPAAPVDLIWTNNTGREITVVRSQIWIGADKGAIADIVAAASRVSDWNILNIVSWDHYADPTALHQNTQPNSLTIAADGGIRLRHFCTAYNEGYIPSFAVALTIWFM